MTNNPYWNEVIKLDANVCCAKLAPDTWCVVTPGHNGDHEGIRPDGSELRMPRQYGGCLICTWKGRDVVFGWEAERDSMAHAKESGHNAPANEEAAWRSEDALSGVSETHRTTEGK